MKRIHIAEAVLTPEGKIDPEKIDLVGRCGGNFYTRSHEGLFEVPKPLTKLGIGVDALPEDVRTSKTLTGNHLAQLGGVEELPNETDVNEYKLTDLADLFIEHEDDAAQLEQELHRIAADLIDNGKVDEAWKALLAFNNG